MLETVTLQHPDSPARAVVLAGFGFNCFEWQAPGPDGALVDMLWAHPNFTSGAERPSGSGIPILFPFPGRIPAATYAWEGRTYQLPARDGRGNAIHGFVHDRPWRVTSASATRVTGQFHASVDAPELLDLWPADFRIETTISLLPRALHIEWTVTNPADRPLPCGLGAHPYFRVPLGGDSPDECLVAIPVRRRWELVELLPTGRTLALPDAEAIQRGRRFGDLQLDDVYTDLAFDGEWATASIFDPRRGRRLVARYDRSFRECVAFTPPHREAICIEPLTCVPGAMTLAARGLATGLRLLAPSESFRAKIELELQ